MSEANFVCRLKSLDVGLIVGLVGVLIVGLIGGMVGGTVAMFGLTWLALWMLTFLGGGLIGGLLGVVAAKLDVGIVLWVAAVLIVGLVGGLHVSVAGVRIGVLKINFGLLNVLIGGRVGGPDLWQVVAVVAGGVAVLVGLLTWLGIGLGANVPEDPMNRYDQDRLLRQAASLMFRAAPRESQRYYLRKVAGLKETDAALDRLPDAGVRKRHDQDRLLHQAADLMFQAAPRDAQRYYLRKPTSLEEDDAALDRLLDADVLKRSR